MTMPAATVTALLEHEFGIDPIREGVARLAARLPARDDTRVLVDFLEDNLREGLEAVEALEQHFLEVLEALREGELSPVLLIDVADSSHALGHVERLISVLPELRRRLSKAAGQLVHR
jgi:hypothetical protein